MDKNIEDSLLKTTSIVYRYNNNIYKGGLTCFFCQNSKGHLYLVTNKHAFENVNMIMLLLSTQNGTEEIKLTLGTDIRMHPKYDLAVIPYSKIHHDIISSGKIPNISTINPSGIVSDFSNFHAIEDILMIGYPDSILDRKNNSPIVRKGVTATSLCEHYNGDDLFITDIPTFWGSSGSPIYYINEKNEPFLIGINCRTFYHKIPIYKNKNRKYHSKIIDEIIIPNDLGLAIKSNILLELIEDSI